MRRRAASAALICGGILLIVAALVLTLYNFWDDDRAEAASRDVLSQLEQYIEDQRKQHEMESDADDPAVEFIPDFILDPEIDMPTVEIEGYAYIGTIHFPSLELTLPVMDTWDYDRIAIAPCRYSGSVYQNDMILCGHNYTAHFGRLRYLSPGARVEFTDVDGNVFRYKVEEIEIIPGTAVEEMLAGDDWDLTLFTCTLSGQTRATLRCTLID